MEKKELNNRREAIFGAGCFWGSEEGFRSFKGVLETKVGYSGGKENKKTYEEVYTDTTGHAEVVKIIYNPNIVSYEELLQRFFFIHFSTEKNKQREDIGTRYRSVIFYKTEEEKKLAKKAILEEQKKYKYKKVATIVEPLTNFYEAERNHQCYFKNQPIAKKVIRYNWLVENYIIKKLFLRFKK